MFDAACGNIYAQAFIIMPAAMEMTLPLDITAAMPMMLLMLRCISLRYCFSLMMMLITLSPDFLRRLRCRFDDISPFSYFHFDTLPLTPFRRRLRRRSR